VGGLKEIAGVKMSKQDGEKGKETIVSMRSREETESRKTLLGGEEEGTRDTGKGFLLGRKRGFGRGKVRPRTHSDRATEVTKGGVSGDIGGVSPRNLEPSLSKAGVALSRKR